MAKKHAGPLSRDFLTEQAIGLAEASALSTFLDEIKAPSVGTTPRSTSLREGVAFIVLLRHHKNQMFSRLSQLGDIC